MASGMHDVACIDGMRIVEAIGGVAVDNRAARRMKYLVQEQAKGRLPIFGERAIEERGVGGEAAFGDWYHRNPLKYCAADYSQSCAPIQQRPAKTRRAATVGDNNIHPSSGRRDMPQCAAP